jgi:SAM-dependent methyltransferase
MREEAKGQAHFKGAVYQRVVKLLKGYASVLDVGCGYGHLVHALADAGIVAVGVDQDPFHVAYAALNRRSARASFLVGRAEDIRPPLKYQAVVLSLVLHELVERKRRALWNHCHRLVGDGGLLVLVDFDIPKQTVRGTETRLMLEGDEDEAGHLHLYRHWLDSVGGLQGWLSNAGFKDCVIARPQHGALTVAAIQK